MNNIATKKARHAKAFESIVSAENKTIIEKILSSVDESSCFSGSRAYDALASLFGKEPTLFLVNLLEAYDIERFIKDIKDISPETRRYLEFLYSTYSYRLGGVLSGSVDRYPDGWIGLQNVSTKYDTNTKKFYLKFEIQKRNKQCLVIEDTAGSMFEMANQILTYITEISKKCPEVQKELDLDQEDIGKLKELVKKFNEVVPTSKRRRTLSALRK